MVSYLCLQPNLNVPRAFKHLMPYALCLSNLALQEGGGQATEEWSKEGEEEELLTDRLDLTHLDI